MNDQVARRVASFLLHAEGIEVVAALIYGSMATGAASAASDIDCLVLVRSEPAAQDIRRLATDFAALQRELGYQPDLDYPIEVFSVGSCARLLGDGGVTHLLRTAAERGSDGVQGDAADTIELVRALTGPRLVALAGSELETMTSLAQDAARRIGAAQPDLPIVGAAGPCPTGEPKLG